MEFKLIINIIIEAAMKIGQLSVVASIYFSTGGSPQLMAQRRMPS